MKYGILTVGAFVITTILHYLWRNEYIMVSDIIIGMISAGLFALLIWYLALHKFPDKIEKVVEERIRIFTGHDSNLSNEHDKIQLSLSSEHRLLENSQEIIKKHTEYLYEDRLRSESKDSDSNALISNLDAAGKKIVDLERTNAQLIKNIEELEIVCANQKYELETINIEVVNSRKKITALEKKIKDMDRSKNRSHNHEFEM